MMKKRLLEHVISDDLRQYRLRKLNGSGNRAFSQISIASKIGISKATLSQWESGYCLPRTLDKLSRWCNALGKDIKDYL
jgi:DNA-binding XRE family transcriptional regulator